MAKKARILSIKGTQYDFHPAIDVVWTTSFNADNYITAGEYHITGIRLSANDNLPIDNVGENASLAGRLIVSVTPEGNTTYRHSVGQVLMLSNAEGKETKIYTRNGNRTILEGGADYVITWGRWATLQTNEQVGLVTSLDDFIDNGIYSGIYQNATDYETFVMVVVNNYAIAKAVGCDRSIAQYKFTLMLNGSAEHSNRTYSNGIWSDWTNENAVVSTKLTRVMNVIFPLEISLSVSPATIQEFTGSSKSFTLSWTAKVDGEPVVPTSIKLQVGDLSYNLSTSATSYTVSATNDTALTLTIEADGRTATKTANINFAKRYYSAVVDGSWTPTEAGIKALAKSALKTSGTATVTYSAATQKKIVFAYPASHGLMSAIKDAYGNSMFILGNDDKTFSKEPTTVTVTLSGGANLQYYVYESNITNIVDGSITYTTATYD